MLHRTWHPPGSSQTKTCEPKATQQRRCRVGTGTQSHFCSGFSARNQTRSTALIRICSWSWCHIDSGCTTATRCRQQRELGKPKERVWKIPRWTPSPDTRGCPGEKIPAGLGMTIISPNKGLPGPADCLGKNKTKSAKHIHVIGSRGIRAGRPKYRKS